jgi:hypothetical protein
LSGSPARETSGTGVSKNSMKDRLIACGGGERKAARRR